MKTWHSKKKETISWAKTNHKSIDDNVNGFELVWSGKEAERAENKTECDLQSNYCVWMLLTFVNNCWLRSRECCNIGSHLCRTRTRLLSTSSSRTQCFFNIDSYSSSSSWASSPCSSWYINSFTFRWFEARTTTYWYNCIRCSKLNTYDSYDFVDLAKFLLLPIIHFLWDQEAYA